MPPVFISAPARMKNGTASSGKESTPVTKRWAITSSGISSSIVTAIAPVRPIATATGAPIASRTTKMIAMVPSMSFPFRDQSIIVEASSWRMAPPRSRIARFRIT